LDACDLQNWIIAVWAFSYQLMAVFTKSHINFVTRVNNFRASLAQAIIFKDELSALLATPTSQTPAKITEMNEALTKIFVMAHPNTPCSEVILRAMA
jgi:hypothetical protein